MKKLSMLIALILIATIGGVYATWTYVTDSQVHSMSTKGVVLTDLSTTQPTVGSYTINSNLNQGIIDQNKDTLPDEDYHKAILTYELKEGASTPSLSVKYTPAVGVSNDIAENGLITYVWFGAPGMTYDCDGDGDQDDIFLVPYGEANYITIHPIGTEITPDARNFVWTKSGNDFVCNIIGEGLVHTDFSAVFTLNDVVLDTEAKYNAYKNSITKFIRCVVSNKLPSETVIGEENNG